MSTSLDVAFDTFMTWRKGGTMSTHTAEAYRHDFVGIADALAADLTVPIEHLTTAVLDKDHMRRAFARFAETRAPASVRRCWSTWNTLCGFWCTEDLLEANPMSTVRRRRCPSGNRRRSTAKLSRNCWPQWVIRTTPTLEPGRSVTWRSCSPPF
ncbi:hypothetical protein GCM10020255_021820 [Rhodococcus baikonurensis]